MGLMDEVLSACGVSGAQAATHGTALTAIMDYINSPQVGGIAGLQSMMQQKGLGGIMSSWLSQGQNQPISQDQLNQVVHNGTLQEVAQKHGIDPSALTGMMSSLLPCLIDKMSPNGQAPDSGMLSQMMKGLAAGR